VAALAVRYGLGPDAPAKLSALLEALEAEPNPPTTVRAARSALDVHVADSLSGLEVPALADAQRVADLGAGAGFPGLVLAAAVPHARVDLIESTARKCQVIRRLGEAAGLTNARAVPQRAEEWARGEGAGTYDVVTARALAPLATLAEYAAPLLCEGGALVAWKGARDEVEEGAGDAAAGILGLGKAEIRGVSPFAGARDRHLHVFTKRSPTPDRFPRRAGMARKRPLG